MLAEEEVEKAEEMSKTSPPPKTLIVAEYGAPTFPTDLCPSKT